MALNLNLNGALAGLGHGLSTLGQQGAEEQQRVAADARLNARETALANLHHDWAEQDIANAPADYKAMSGVTVDRAAQEAERVQLPLRRVEAQLTRDNADHNSARDFQEQMALLNARERAQFQTWRQQHGIEQADTRTLDLWRRDNGITAAANAAPPSRRNGTTGNYEEYRGGQWVDTGTRYPVSHADDLGLDDNGDAGGTPAPPTGRGGRPVIAAPRPAARGNDTPPVASARRASDGQWYVTRNGRNFLVQGN